AMAANAFASRPHRRVDTPFRAAKAARAVPQEPAPRTASVGRSAMASGSAVERRSLVAAGHSALLLGVQSVEIDRLQQEGREAAFQHQAGNDLTGVGEQQVRAVAADDAGMVRLAEACNAEQTGLLPFGP